MADWLMIVCPPGDPEQVGAAAAKLRSGAEELALLADDFSAAAHCAGVAWTGPSPAAFTSRSISVGNHLSDTASAYQRIAATLGSYRDALEGAQSAATRARQQIAKALDGYATRGRVLASDIANELEPALPSGGFGPMATILITRLRSWHLPPGFAPYFETRALPPRYFPPSAIVADLSGPAGAGLSAQLMEMPPFVLDVVPEGQSKISALEDELATSVSDAQTALRTSLSDLRSASDRAGSHLLDIGRHFFARVPDPALLGDPTAEAAFQ